MVARPVLPLVFLCIMLAGGCADTRELMPTPNLYRDDKTKLFSELAPELSSTKVEMIYVTDRAPETDAAGNLHYGFHRSSSISVGTTVVDLGENITWGQLVEARRTQIRIGKFELKLVSTNEFTRLPPTPTPYRIIDGKVVEDAQVTEKREKSVSLLRDEMARRLALTSRKDVFLYIHGYHNTFEDAAFALAELWHFFGREGLPIIYSWPAGFSGLFGYTYDRESSEFTVYHLKQVIRWLSEQPEVENIHLIAHSRGTDVAVSAFRELVLSSPGSRAKPGKMFKIANFVLAALDLDVSVVSQRIAAERLGLHVGKATLYASPEDKAIGIAERLFASPRGRLGTLDISELNEREAAAMEANAARLTVVNFKGESDGIGHSYFRTNPSVSSDLVLLIRYGFVAGSPGRPLEHIGLNFWRVPSDYSAGARLN